MKTVAKILELTAPLEAGFYIWVENEPWMTIVIEDTQERGPNGLPAISVAYYGEQNGDLMRDPEMIFAACYVPARRAMRVDPIVTLRSD